MDNYVPLRKLIPEELSFGTLLEDRIFRKLLEQPSSGRRRKTSGRTPEKLLLEEVTSGRFPEYFLLLPEEGCSGSFNFF